MNKLIKIYGERNTNTNYMSELVKLNLDAQEMPGTVPALIMQLQSMLPGNELVRDLYFQLSYAKNLGWKHSRVNPEKILKNNKIAKLDLVFLTLTKNPYSWLLSLYRRPYHQYYTEEIDFETFLQRPWKTVARDNTLPELKSPIQLWNIKNASYLHLTQQNALNITTESIFKDPEAIIDQISKQLSIEKLSDTFVNYERSTKEEGRDSHYYQDYYLHEKWRDEFSSVAIDIINKTVDQQLMSHFGYTLLS